MRQLIRFASHVVSGLRFRLLLLVIVTCAPLVALTLHTAWEDRRRAMTGWSQRTERMMQVASREEEKLILQTRQLLVAMAESTPARTGNSRGCKKLVDELFGIYPRYANLGMISTNGEVLASALTVGLKLSEEDAKLFHRVMESHTFAIGDLPLNTAAGRPIVNFAYPVYDRAGQAHGAVFASLDLTWFNRFGSELPNQLPKGATWTEVGR